jgi:hypothetical protein
MLVKLFEFLNKITFELNGFTVYYGWLLIGLILISMVASVFWRGVKG